MLGFVVVTGGHLFVWVLTPAVILKARASSRLLGFVKSVEEMGGCVFCRGGKEPSDGVRLASPSLP